jgi:hypothetical protein
MLSLNHITLSTGNLARTPHSALDSSTMEFMCSWLDKAIASKSPVSLGVPSLNGFTALATAEDNDLLVTLYGGELVPIVTFGCAPRSSSTLWSLLLNQGGLLKSMSEPEAPWCGVVLHLGISIYTDHVHWLGDWERCVAWAWIYNCGLGF